MAETAGLTITKYCPDMIVVFEDRNPTQSACYCGFDGSSGRCPHVHFSSIELLPNEGGDDELADKSLKFEGLEFNVSGIDKCPRRLNLVDNKSLLATAQA
ncbi:MAG: hypothetical protein NT076_04055 [Candidatus Pacearchaeota archaeon]|nr:hypothetical protein [Candidatus Pacearchaeota archaeon]